MNEHLELLDMTVADVLNSTPAAVRFFISQHTGCVGCLMAHFCSIGDVTKIYEYDEKTFLEELAKYNVQTILTRSEK